MYFSERSSCHTSKSENAERVLTPLSEIILKHSPQDMFLVVELRKKWKTLSHAGKELHAEGSSVLRF